MNLIFRLFWLSLVAKFGSQVSVLEPCRTAFRCWPTDLDVLGHMNNSKYFGLMDLARVDLMTRSGILAKLTKRGWYPVVVGETIKFKKSIRLFDKIEVESVILGWDEKAFIVAQRFFVQDNCLADAVVRARFLKKSGGTVTPQEVLSLAGESRPSPPFDPWVSSWNQYFV